MDFEPQRTLINLIAVVVAVTDETPRVLVVNQATDSKTAGMPSLPNGPFDPFDHVSLESGLRTWVETQTGLDLRYVEQLYTFGNRNRDPVEIRGGPRVVSVAYVALTHEGPVRQTRAEWRDWYGFMPWEDWRLGRPRVIDEFILPSLKAWSRRADGLEQRRQRRERINVTFSCSPGTEMDSVLSLERFELLYEAGLVQEAVRDRAAAGACPPGCEVPADMGTGLDADHRRILATALGRLRGKLAYRPVVFELLPEAFTLLQLQRVVEALSGARLHKQNFRRLVTKAELVEPTGTTASVGRGRPPRLFRFRREVLGEKLTVGLSRPIMRSADA